MGFKVLEIGDPAWIATVMSMPPERRDVHFDQRMLAPYVRTYNWQAGLAVSDFRENRFIQPILINNQGQLRHAYNFGGSVSIFDIDGARDHFHALRDWAVKHGATNEYCTLNPFFVKHQLQLLAQTDVKPEYIKDSVFIDLQNLKPKRRGIRYANKAQGLGGQVISMALTDENIQAFYEMYLSTMDRTEAKDNWKFSLDFFVNFTKLVKPVLMVAFMFGVAEAASLMVLNSSFPVAYYHFTGCYNNYPLLGVNHMLLLASAEFCKAQGAKALYLGGGVTPDDGVFAFKAGFSDLRLPVYQYHGQII